MRIFYQEKIEMRKFINEFQARKCIFCKRSTFEEEVRIYGKFPSKKYETSKYEVNLGASYEF